MEKEYQINKKALWSKWLFNLLLSLFFLAILYAMIFIWWGEHGLSAFIVCGFSAFFICTAFFCEAFRYYYFKLTINDKMIIVLNGMSHSYFKCYWDEISHISLNKRGDKMELITLPGEKVKLNHYIDQYQNAFKDITNCATKNNPKIVVEIK